MPNRILRDWTDSEKINSLSAEAERFFTRLIMKVDDFGKYTANTKMLKATLFPLKDGLRDSDISRCLAECEAAGLLAVYSVENKPLLKIKEFNQRLRRMVSKYPDPDGQMTVKCQSDDGLNPNPNPNPNPKRIRNEVRVSEAHAPDKPFFSDVFKEADRLDIPEAEAHGFWDYYEARKWMVDGRPCGNWKSLFGTWSKRYWEKFSNGKTKRDPEASALRQFQRENAWRGEPRDLASSARSGVSQGMVALFAKFSEQQKKYFFEVADENSAKAMKSMFRELFPEKSAALAA